MASDRKRTFLVVETATLMLGRGPARFAEETGLQLPWFNRLYPQDSAVLNTHSVKLRP